MPKGTWIGILTSVFSKTVWKRSQSNNNLIPSLYFLRADYFINIMVTANLFNSLMNFSNNRYSTGIFAQGHPHKNPSVLNFNQRSGLES